MIKINITEPKLNVLLEKQWQYYLAKGDPILKEYINTTTGPEKAFFQLINQYKETIIKGRPNELDEVIKLLETENPDACRQVKNPKTNAGQHIRKVFDYEKFSRSIPTRREPSKWGAYALAIGLKVNVCPYCNRQFITTFFSPKSKTKTRPAFDHFWDKATYPYLALSFFNLIPSCNVCNSSFKGTKKFSLTDNINPYEAEFGDRLKFGIGISRQELDDKTKYDINFFYGHSPNFKILLKDDGNSCDSTVIRARNNADVFKIEDLYESHKDYVLDIIRLAIMYNEDKIQELLDTYPRLFKTRDDVVKNIVSNCITNDSLDKRVLAKLTKDISEELGLI